MTPETAKIWVVVITTIGTLVWLTSLTVLLRAGRERRESTRQAAERFEVDGDFTPGAIVGEAEVDGQPEEISTKLASDLARDGMGPFGPVKIIDRDRHEIRFESAGAPMPGFRSGRIRFASTGLKTRVAYAVESSRSWHLALGWIFQAAGLVAILAAPTLAMTLAVSSPDPNIRAQAIQVVQMVHLLWPPFLFAHLSRVPGRMIRGRMESLVHNLPYR